MAQKIERTESEAVLWPKVHKNSRNSQKLGRTGVLKKPLEMQNSPLQNHFFENSPADLETSDSHYMPMVGRFVSKDPLLFGGGQANLYAYAINDPVNFVEPTGQWYLSLSLGGGVSGALGMGAGVSRGTTFGFGSDGFFSTPYTTGTVCGGAQAGGGAGGEASVGFNWGSDGTPTGNSISYGVFAGVSPAGTVSATGNSSSASISYSNGFGPFAGAGITTTNTGYGPNSSITNGK